MSVPLNNSAIIIQARMGSTRMPGKVLEPFYAGKSILDIILQTLRTSVHQLPVVLATSVSSLDDQLEAWARTNNIGVFRGHETNVLSRFTGCCGQFGFDYVVRVCADNPFLDVDLLDKMVAAGIAHQADYCSYMAADDTPAMKSHLGIFAEWVTTAALTKAQTLTDDPLFTEHVTNFIYGNPDQFRLHWLKAPEVLYNRTDLRFTIDTPEDFTLMQELYSLLAERGVPINFINLLTLVESDTRALQIMQNQIRRFTK